MCFLENHHLRAVQHMGAVLIHLYLTLGSDSNLGCFWLPVFV